MAYPTAVSAFHVQSQQLYSVQKKGFPGLSPMSFVKFQYLNCKSAIVSEVDEIKKNVLILLKVIFFRLGYADATVAAVCAELPSISHDLDVPTEANVSQLAIGNVLHKNPPDIKTTLPFVLGPHTCTCVVVHSRFHFCNATKVSTAVDTE
ncbi:hypothetical protein MC885_015670, partial [Smutsia gigantea]